MLNLILRLNYKAGLHVSKTNCPQSVVFTDVLRQKYLPLFKTSLPQTSSVDCNIPVNVDPLRVVIVTLQAGGSLSVIVVDKVKEVIQFFKVLSPYPARTF